MFFALVEAAVFRLVVLGRKEAAGLQEALTPFVDNMLNPNFEWNIENKED